MCAPLPAELLLHAIDGRIKTFSFGSSTKTMTYDNAGRITGISDSLTPR
jgi:hypothetical protein